MAEPDADWQIWQNSPLLRFDETRGYGTLRDGAHGLIHLFHMRIPRWLFWFLVYGVATACWAIYFEYGHGTQRFLYGAQRSVLRVFDYVRDAVGAGEKPVPSAPGLSPMSAPQAQSPRPASAATVRPSSTPPVAATP